MGSSVSCRSLLKFSLGCLGYGGHVEVFGSAVLWMGGEEGTFMVVVEVEAYTAAYEASSSTSPAQCDGFIHQQQLWLESRCGS